MKIQFKFPRDEVSTRSFYNHDFGVTSYPRPNPMGVYLIPPFKTPQMIKDV